MTETALQCAVYIAQEMGWTPERYVIDFCANTPFCVKIENMIWRGEGCVPFPVRLLGESEERLKYLARILHGRRRVGENVAAIAEMFRFDPADVKAALEWLNWRRKP